MPLSRLRLKTIHRRFVGVIVVALTAFCLIAWGQESSIESIALLDTRIIQEIRGNNELLTNLEYLSDVIGPRVTGTANLQRAGDWATDLCHRYKLDDVHAEGWT